MSQGEGRNNGRTHSETARRQADRRTHRQTDAQAETDKQTHQQTDRQVDRQTDSTDRQKQTDDGLRDVLWNDVRQTTVPQTGTVPDTTTTAPTCSNHSHTGQGQGERRTVATVPASRASYCKGPHWGRPCVRSWPSSTTWTATARTPATTSQNRRYTCSAGERVRHREATETVTAGEEKSTREERQREGRRDTLTARHFHQHNIAAATSRRPLRPLVSQATRPPVSC